MAKKRARLTDHNDPLSSTDQVLAGFEQLSQSTSQPEDKSDSQQVNQSTSQPEDKSDSPEVESSSKQEDEKQSDNQSIRQKNKKSTSQLVKSDTLGDKPTSQKEEKSTSEQVDKLMLRKVTFQIQESVVNRLDRLHLQLQLDLGKTNAPYKEVIVEEAISQLLEEMESKRDKWIEALQQRQEQRHRAHNRGGRGDSMRC